MNNNKPSNKPSKTVVAIAFQADLNEISKAATAEEALTPEIISDAGSSSSFD